MEEDVSESRNLIVTTLKQLQGQLSDILSSARKLVHESVDNFVAKKIGCLWPAVNHYSSAFERLEVTTKPGLERKIRKHYSDPEIRDVFEELLQVESEWDSFLRDVDNTLKNGKSSENAIKVGQKGPVDLELTDARSEQKHEFDKNKTKVIVLSFGVREGALLWLKETGCTFDLLLDPERQVYTSIGLTRSVVKTWGVTPLLYYAEAKASGKPIPQAHKGIEDDPLQMGGDFVMDKDGEMTLIHCSKTSTDRPTIPQLLSHIRDFSQQSSSSSSEEQ